MLTEFLQNVSLDSIDFSRDIFPTVSDRNYWEAFPKGDAIAAAEEALDYAWPPIKATDFMAFKATGDRKIMENIHFARRRALTALALGECIENQGRFLPQLVNGIFTTCEESYWGLSAHWFHEVGNIPTPAEPYIDLFVGETAEHLVMIYHMLYEPLYRFCPEILARIEYELDRRVKTPYLTHMDFWWMGYRPRGSSSVNNWNPWILSNVLTTFLLEEKNPTRLRRAVAKIMSELEIFYAHYAPDGGCNEGPHYWGHAGGSFFENLYLLKLASHGKIDFFGDEKVKNIASYLQKVHIDGAYFANFADAHATPLFAHIGLLYGFARETEQPQLMSFAASIAQSEGAHRTGFHYSSRRTTLRRSLLDAEFWGEMESYPVTDTCHNTLELLPDLQVATLRHGSLILCAKGGHNRESHNHNDVGSFVLYDGGRPVLVDPGIGVYTKFTFGTYRYDYIPWVHSRRHNLPFVNGVRQEYGEEYRASDFSADENAVSISFPNAYPATSGLTALDRTLSLNETDFTLCDHFDFADGKGGNVTEMLLTVLPVRIDGDAVVLDDRYRITTNVGAWAQEFLSFEGDQNLTADWGTEGVTRLSLTVENAEDVRITLKKI